MDGAHAEECDSLKSHSHKNANQYNGGISVGYSNYLLPLGSSTGYVVDTSSEGGAETRPKNIAVLPLIIAK